MKDLFTKAHSDRWRATMTGVDGCLSLETANKIFHDWVAQQTVVYSNDTKGAWLKEPFNVKAGYSARIFDIQSIERDSLEKLAKDLVEWRGEPPYFGDLKERARKLLEGK